MRTKTVTVYSFNELSDKAKERAVNDYFSGGFEYPYATENSDTLNKFCELFGIKCKNFEYGYHNYINLNLDMVDDCILELKGVRLLKYLMNNYYSDLFKPLYRKALKTDNKHVNHSRIRVTELKNGKILNSYYSAIEKSTDCVLTGYCIDNDILEPVYRFIKKPSNYTTFQDMLHECGETWLKACREDYEYCSSIEAIGEDFEANEYEFDEHGKRV